MTKIFFAKCLCTTEQRQLAIRLKQEGYSLRITDNDKAAKEEALTYNAKIPFTVDDGVVTEL